MQKVMKLIPVTIIFSAVFSSLTCYAQTTYRPIPAKIQAESWDAKDGGQYALPTGDVDGVNDVVGLAITNSLDYNLHANTTGLYKIDFRVATTQNNAQFEIRLVTGTTTTTLLSTINITTTGGWSVYTTQSVNNVSLTAGDQKIRIVSTNSETCNFNWLDFALENGGGNPPPTANASGQPTTITLPVNQVSLSGSGSPGAGSIISHIWTKIGGPQTGGNIAAPNIYNTTATDMVEGVYVFRLTVTQTDNQTVSPEVTITVNAANSSILPIAGGGTGQSSFVDGFIKSNGTALTSVAIIPIAYGGTGKILFSDGYIKSVSNSLNSVTTIPGTDILGDIPGSAASLSSTLLITKGGTGATNATGALANLLPPQSGNNGKFLKTDGTGITSWATVSSGGSSQWIPTTVGNNIYFMNNVGIGTTDPGTYKLAVEGTLGARKVRVTQTSWSDYVFEKTYHLPTLAEVERFVQQNKHLPGVPSAKEVEKQGLDLGDNQAILLKKIEEMTLYLIEQNKRIEEQNKRIEQLEKTIKKNQGHSNNKHNK